jgi:hypothetical protein
MGHIPPGYGTAACPSNITSFTDNPVVADTTVPRAIHQSEIKSTITAESQRRRLSATPAVSSVTADTTLWRKAHIDELRAAINYLQVPTEMPAHSCPTNSDSYCPANTYGWCPSDTHSAFTWTDPTITIDQTLIRAIHVNELRTNLTAETTTCVCEQEACNYCSDCGYAIPACSYSPCACDNHKYVECGNYPYTVYSCATVNSSGTWVPQTAPWNCMCNFTPPGKSWIYYNPPHSPAYSHPEWGCMCNPFTWTT